ncbi:Putative gfo/Idh/MocA-like oxidoreductase, NAD(P)-binding domain superfamily [Septoria linicola]|uniref:D-xylose 1-dehydrogenase (NADP(+), D-xylono-1,5-lactone-forming) n=1 Tax=Septoria linicola TaxID=215465 RepID=A0A9Q9AI17_9PEZI|nr:putative gfo/Idh/MocA-like oxidoreductase, NAD(P)-binding domain superfamily [Septoria linicola]USW49627.1 Putative gfo/Idh/MocA-like oxidoreductase, NAD(P)-binding domain superfamily [Septoria linicola]
MSWLVQVFVNFDKILGVHNWYNGVAKHKKSLVKTSGALKVGVLGAANINIAAIIDPISTHADAILVGIAARDIKKAQAQIDRYGLGEYARAYGSYQDLLDDESIDAVYIPLPNGLHHEWAIKSLRAGKHVLLEKPFTSNAAQARELTEAAAVANKICLEAFHWRFHPAAHHVKSIIESGKYGDVVKLSSHMTLPRGTVDKDDIRFKYSLAGGASMDLTYVLSTSSYFAVPAFEDSEIQFTVHSAVPRLNAADDLVDNAMEARFTIEPPGKRKVECHTVADLELPPLWGLIPRLDKLAPEMFIECETATIHFANFVAPYLNHTITITEKGPDGTFMGQKVVEKCYTDGPQWQSRGQAWWTTYRYQLEVFVDQVRAKESGREYKGPTMTLQESTKLMSLIDAVYDKAGLPRRGV